MPSPTVAEWPSAEVYPGELGLIPVCLVKPGGTSVSLVSAVPRSGDTIVLEDGAAYTVGAVPRYVTVKIQTWFVLVPEIVLKATEP